METYFLHLPVELKIRVMKCIPGWNSQYKINQYIYVALGAKCGKESEYTIAKVIGFVYNNNQYDYEMHIMPRITKAILNPLPISTSYLDTLHYLTTKRYYWRRGDAIKYCSNDELVSDFKRSYNTLIESLEIESNKPDTDMKERTLLYINKLLIEFEIPVFR